jgi:hypothetical protein
MKKHKSVVAILLAVMMIFTFMPTMAFATVTWGDDYQTASTDVKNHVPLGVEITWTVGSGKMTAKTIDASAETYGTTANVKDDLNVTAEFYDLAGATFKADGKAIPASMGYDAFKKIADGNAVLSLALVQPAYTKGYQAATADKTAAITFAKNATTGDIEAKVGKWTLKAVIEGFDATVANADQNAKISLVKTASSTSTAADVLGTVTPITVAIKGTPDSYASAEMAVDGKKAGEKDALPVAGWKYDGAEHTVAIVSAGNATLKYELFNESTGKFEAKTALTFKDAGTYTWKASATDPTDATKVKSFPAQTTTIGKADAWSFGFDEDGNYSRYGENDKYTFRVDEGAEVDPWEYVVVATKEDKAAAANEALIKEYIKDFFTITSDTKKATPYRTDYTMKAKTEDELSAAERKTLVEGKYKALLANMNAPTDVARGAGALHVYAFGSDDFEVSFTKIASKTYHIKKAKKTKKAYSFTVKAEAANGAEVKYVLKGAPAKIKIDTETGKITVKKGLKKGKYSFTVKAYVPGHQSASGEGFVTQKIKVTVKK